MGETDQERRRCVAVGLLDYTGEVHADWGGMWGVCGEACRGVLEGALPDDISAFQASVQHMARGSRWW